MTHVDNVDQCILLNDLRHISSITKPKGDGFFCVVTRLQSDETLILGLDLVFLYILGFCISLVSSYPEL